MQEIGARPADQSEAAAEMLLRRCWLQWMAIVELFALRKRARHRVKVDGYHELHVSMMTACQVLAQKTQDEKKRQLFLKMEHLVRPWVSVQSLLFADQQVARKLLSQCQQAHREWTGRAPLSKNWRRVLTVAFVGFVLAVGVLLAKSQLQTGSLGTALPAVDDAEGLFYLARYHFRRTTVMQRVFVGGGIVTVLTIFVVYRSAKSY